MRTRAPSLTPKLLVGKRLYLRPYREDDLKFRMRWMHDPEILGLTCEVKPWTEADLASFYDRVRNEKERAWFSAVLKKDDRVIGEPGLLRAFWPWKTTDLTIEINEKDVWNRGYGSEAIQLLMERTFGKLGFHHISIGVVGFNDRALRFFRRTDSVARGS